MSSSLETNRLTLRPLKIEDAPFVVELFNSETWLRYIGDRGIHTVEAAEDFLRDKALKFFAKFGWGSYLISLKADKTPVGTVGLYKRDELDIPDFGYALLPDHAGQGIATEAGKTMLHYIKEQHDFAQILAIVQSQNLRSIRVLTKLGFRESHEQEIASELMQVWSKTLKRN